MILTAENYFTPEANMKYMSASQYKSFANCEACALAELRGEWERKVTPALLVGSYVDAHFEGTLTLFQAKNPAVFTQKGELRSEYRHAEYVISRIERDEMFMSFLAGEKQVVRTGEIEGVPFKTKIDVLHANKAIVDLKIMRDFESQYKNEQGRLNFIEYWGYDIQGAIYQEVERQHCDKKLPFYIAAATKEPEPDIGIFEIPQYHLDATLKIVKHNIPHYQNIKNGLYEPERCEACDYCKFTKKLTAVKSMEVLNT